MTSPEPDFTELVDADIPRVDLVDKAANGMRFLIAKDAAGLMDPEYVRDLIAKTTPDDEQVTMTGSPAAIARLIHQAGREPVAKEGVDLDASELLADPDPGAAGIPTTPGTPAWESVDAATAQKWVAILVRAQHAVSMLADREMLEAASGACEDDAYQAMDLEDAACAIDYAIGILAPFAVAEQAEAEFGAETAMVGKALAGFDATGLDTIASLAVVTKAGRTLSAANEAAIRQAADALQKVLASLPAAPTPDEPVAKAAEAEEATMPETATATAEGVVKADGEKTPQVAVYNSKGQLVGIVDPESIVPIAGVDTDTAGEPAAEAEPVEPEATETTDTEPAPADQVGTPADAVADGVSKEADPVLKGIAAAMIKQQLDAYSATQQEVIAKQAADLKGLAETISVLKGQVAALEEQPAAPRAFANGAVPPSSQLRGQDVGAPAVGVAEAQQMRKGLYAPSAVDRNKAAGDMQALAIAELQRIHSGKQ
jgi:hypothetical protein